MNVIPRAVRFIVVPVAAQMQEIQFVNQTLFLEKFDGSVDGYQVHAGINALRPLENLINVEMLLRIVHHLENHAALAREPDTPGSKHLGQTSSSFGSIDPLAGRSAMRGCGCHEIPRLARRTIESRPQV